jgi:hypothetical protein
MMEDFNDTAERAGEALAVAESVAAKAQSPGGGLSRLDRLLHRQRPKRGPTRRA